MLKSKKTENENVYTWDKDKYITEQNDKKRNLDWYKRKYRFNLNISLGLIITSFLFSSTAFYNILQTSKEKHIYITSTSGGLYDYKIENDKKILLKEALDEVRKKRNMK